jgi:hypothetical protein
MTTELGKAAERLCDLIPPASLPHEVLVIDRSLVSVVVDLDGTDYILTMQVVPKQRPRPLPA